MVSLSRSGLRILPDPTRVIARPFLPGVPTFGDGPSRVEMIVGRILDLSEAEAGRMLAQATDLFMGRHADLDRLWEAHAAAALAFAQRDPTGIDEPRRRLIGAYFTQEYGLEAASVCNPSMVPHPHDRQRFVMTLRAIGEGHISSVEFRTGTFGPGPSVVLDPPHPLLDAGTRSSPTYERAEFVGRLTELHPDPDLTETIFAPLGDRFSLADLDESISRMHASGVSEAASFETVRLIHWVATSNYEVAFGDVPLSGRVLVPAGPADSQGMEDVRMVRFHDDDGSVSYYGTYTAFDGFTILPQLIETDDFTRFRISTLRGSSARNKGMALFPRRIGGRYVALGRMDRESIHVMRSDRIRAWEESDVVYPPRLGWEAVQVGNCGPPIETGEGWLVLTHGVGPMRRYVIGAILLDLDRPERLVARLEEPLLEPDPDERDGYVPNVVYSCGGMIHEGALVLPFGYSDHAVGLGTIPLSDLLDALTPV